MYKGIRLSKLIQPRHITRGNTRACSAKPESSSSESTTSTNTGAQAAKEGVSVNIGPQHIKYLLGGLAVISTLYYVSHLNKSNNALKMVHNKSTENTNDNAKKHSQKQKQKQKHSKKQAPPPKDTTNYKMHADLQLLLSDIRRKRGFCAEQWIDEKCRMFNAYMSKCGLKGAIVSLSGGVDSATTLGLVKRASQMPGSPISKILAVSQPIHSSDWAYDRAKECASKLNVEMITIDQTPNYDVLSKYIEDIVGIPGGIYAGGQLRSYMRTPAMYYVAQLLTQSGYPTVVMGTGNKDEDGYLAYFCKAGDGVVDVQLIADLHKSETFTVAKMLGVPASILNAKPSADLWDGQQDEQELGFTYDFIEFWVYYKDYSDAKKDNIRKALSKEALMQLDQWGALADGVHRRNAHKFDSPVNINIM